MPIQVIVEDFYELRDAYTILVPIIKHLVFKRPNNPSQAELSGEQLYPDM